MSLQEHRNKEFLGGLVYLLTIDMSPITGDPLHRLRFTNNYGSGGTGIIYQGNSYKPHPYEIKQVKRKTKASKSSAKLAISDNDFVISRFIDDVGGSIQDARVLELKVYGRYLDTGVEANPLAYIKRLDHVVNFVEDSDKRGELIIHTIDPLSKDLSVPSLSFSAGIPNSAESSINIFPAVDRRIVKGR